jgi:hypothetical protein
MKAKRASSKYEVRCEALVFQREKMKPSLKYEVQARNLHQNTKPKSPSSKYKVKETFMKIQRQRKLHQNTRSGVKPSFFREKMKHSSKYEEKARSLRQNTKPKRPSSKYEVTETFVKIRRQRMLHQNTKSDVKTSFF